MAHPDQEALLLVQAADTTSDQLRHRRSSLPERAAVAGAEAGAVAAKQAHDGLAARVEALALDQSGLEAQLATTEARAVAVDTRLRSGESTAARDLVRWAEEVDHLRERASALEDEAFAVLVERETAETELALLAGRLAAAVAAVRSRRAELAAAEAAVDSELAQVQRQRTAAAAAVPADLLARYDKLRAHLGGTGAARLVDGSCTGCHLALSPRDLDDFRRAPEDAVLACEACGRILVRS